MKIIIKKEPLDDDMFNEDFSVDCVLETPDDANCGSVVSMMCKAAFIEGFNDEAFVRAMKEYVDYWEWEHKIKIKLEDERENENESDE